jgi:AcrR family transcriptional regulator
MTDHAPTVPAGTNARGRATRQRLLEAAAECFGEQGYAAVRVSDVTDRAEVSHGAFYRHFRDKKELLLEALGEPLDELLRAMGPTAGAPLDRASVQQVTTAFFTVYARHRRVLRVLRELVAVHDPELTALWLEVRRRYVRPIEAWMERSPLPAGVPADHHLLAEALGSVADQLAYTQLGLATEPVGDAEARRLGAIAAHVWSASLGI